MTLVTAARPISTRGVPLGSVGPGTGRVQAHKHGKSLDGWLRAADELVSALFLKRRVHPTAHAVESHMLILFG